MTAHNSEMFSFSYQTSGGTLTPLPSDPLDQRHYYANRKSISNDVLAANGRQLCAVLSVAEMYRADSAAVAAGISASDLMAHAGRAVYTEICKRFSPCKTVVLCGPGNNGGDGHIIADLLKEAGWPVRVAIAISGDSRTEMPENCEILHPSVLDGAQLVIDALFGAGLARALDGQVRATIEMLNQRQISCVAVDMPSGVHGDTGSVLGVAPKADLTVTFFRPKPGHLLYPGRGYCGEIVVTDIGIPESCLSVIRPRQFINVPELWMADWPWHYPQDHKYQRGHVAVLGNPDMPGAACLALRAARRTGIGVAAYLVPKEARHIFSLDQPGALVYGVDNGEEFENWLIQNRPSALIIGPGAGITVPTAEKVLIALRHDVPLVLDADGLSVFQDNPQVLFKAIAARNAPVILTPHEGEFKRLFPDIKGDKLLRVRSAARESGAVIVLKGADTVLSVPGNYSGQRSYSGVTIMNSCASLDLAVAGAGDVLAGCIGGLLARGMNAAAAAAAGIWVHSQAGRQSGPGLIAEDLCEALPGILQKILLHAQQQYGWYHGRDTE